VILVVSPNLVWQKVGRLARLSHGHVNRFLEMSSFSSGKGPDVVRALAALGGNAETIGYAGGPNGLRLREDLVREGLRCRVVPIGGETRICMTIAEEDGTCTEIVEPSPRVTDAERAEMRRVVLERLPETRLLVISGTAPEGESDDCYAVLLQAARARHTPVMLDSACRQARIALVQAPAVLKVNEHELGELAGAPTDSLPRRVAACGRIAEEHGVRWFLITRGAEGIEAFDGRTLLWAPAPRVKVVNAIGSGDAVAAGAGWVIHEAITGGDHEHSFLSSPEVLREALLTATAMGTANCMNPVNGRVIRADYLSVREQVRIRDLPLP
jgi:1-phosphofructokinase family hexose kinase